MTDRQTDGRTDGQTDGQTHGEKQYVPPTGCLPTLSGGDIIVYEIHVIQQSTCMIFLFMKTILQHSVYFNLFFLGFMSFKTLCGEINTIT